MTQEEQFAIQAKAKRYDEAVEKLRSLHDNYDTVSTLIDIKEEFENIFPELKECEDERIRKEIITFIVTTPKERNNHKKWIAWLEAQGEHDNFRNKIQIGDKVTRNEDGVLVNLSQLKRVAKPAEEYNITGIGSKNAQGKLGEMIKNLKPVNEVLEHESAWSEKYIADVFEKVGLAKIAREQSNDTLTNALQDAMIELSKFTPQPKQEWSEEDKEMSRFIGNAITTNGASIYLKSKGIQVIDAHVWLNGLKERVQPQNRWKPSREQIETLEYYMHTLVCNNYKETLFGLYQDLKKLMEE